MKNSNFLSWVQIWANPEHPPPPLKWKNSNFLSWVQIWAYPEHPPRQWKTLTFFPEFKSELTQNTCPQKMKNSNFLSWVQIWAYPEHPPPRKWKTLTFFPEFKSELTQNTPLPRKWKTLTFFPEFKSANLSLPRTPPPHGGWSMWRLYPPRILSSFIIRAITSNDRPFDCHLHRHLFTLLFCSLAPPTMLDTIKFIG